MRWEGETRTPDLVGLADVGGVPFRAFPVASPRHGIGAAWLWAREVVQDIRDRIVEVERDGGPREW